MPDKIVSAKKALRKEALAKRNAMDERERAVKSRLAAMLLVREQAVTQPQTIALFANFKSEIDTKPLADALRALGKTIAYPLALPGEARLEFYHIHDMATQCQPGLMGIHEPVPTLCEGPLTREAIDIVIVPGLLFSDDGVRLGYGGGYYDRLLQQMPHALSIGYGFACQRVRALPYDRHDVMLTAFCSEEGLEVFNHERWDRC